MFIITGLNFIKEFFSQKIELFVLHAVIDISCRTKLGVCSLLRYLPKMAVFSVLGTTFQGQKGGSKTLNDPLFYIYFFDFQ